MARVVVTAIFRPPLPHLARHRPPVKYSLASTPPIEIESAQLATMAACVVEAAAAAAAGRPTRKRTRVTMGTTEDYEETCRLGEGAFGAVVKARHRATGRAVAMKYLGEAGGGNAALLREARFLEACAANPFVVGSRGLARDPATAELCPGFTLSIN